MSGERSESSKKTRWGGTARRGRADNKIVVDPRGEKGRLEKGEELQGRPGKRFKKTEKRG